MCDDMWLLVKIIASAYQNIIIWRIIGYMWIRIFELSKLALKLCILISDLISEKDYWCENILL